jgi:hypothetical protein
MVTPLEVLETTVNFSASGRHGRFTFLWGLWLSEARRGGAAVTD